MAIGFDSECNLVSSGPTVFAAVAARQAADDIAFWAAAHAAGNVRHAAGKAIEEEKAVRWMTNVLRDISGNPFRHVTLDPTCRTAAVISLATAAYEERILPAGHLDNARLRVLSDALEDAGCTDRGILDHLRSTGPHVRGCWVVDALLGRK
jgi:hypothetical protein